MFEEERVDSAFHRLKSSANPAWYLGFNRRRQRPGTPTLPAHPARRGNMVNKNKCEAHFHTAGIETVKPVYSGVLQVLSELDTQITAELGGVVNSNPAVTLAAELNDLSLSRAHSEAIRTQQSLARAHSKRIRHKHKKQLRISRKLKNLRRKSASRN